MWFKLSIAMTLCAVACEVVPAVNDEELLPRADMPVCNEEYDVSLPDGHHLDVNVWLTMGIDKPSPVAKLAGINVIGSGGTAEGVETIVEACWPQHADILTEMLTFSNCLAGADKHAVSHLADAHYFNKTAFSTEINPLKLCVAIGVTFSGRSAQWFAAVFAEEGPATF